MHSSNTLAMPLAALAQDTLATAAADDGRRVPFERMCFVGSEWLEGKDDLMRNIRAR